MLRQVNKDTAEYLAHDCVWEAKTRGITKTDLIEAAGGSEHLHARGVKPRSPRRGRGSAEVVRRSRRKERPRGPRSLRRAIPYSNSECMSESRLSAPFSSTKIQQNRKKARKTAFIVAPQDFTPIPPDYWLRRSLLETQFETPFGNTLAL